MFFRNSKSAKPLPDHLLWPNDLQNKFFTGFSPSDLELLCDWELRGYDDLLPYKTPFRLYWPAELYSFGRCYREWLGFPSWVPLPMSGDHGAWSPGGSFSPHELNSKTNIHLSWHDKRFEILKSSSRKNVIHCPHPWITFKNRLGLKRKNSSCGTLVFLPHSCVGIEVEDYSFNGYIDELLSLPPKFHPFILCIHRHDVQKKLHLQLLDYNLPIITAGETSSPYFVERFYSMISNFRFATSSDIGSQSFYCEDFGVRYFCKGREPTYIDAGNETKPPFVVKLDKFGIDSAQTARRLFAFPPVDSEAKTYFVRRVLGLTIDEKTAKISLLSVLPREYLRHMPEILIMVARRLARRFLVLFRFKK